jgi:tRNA modification GTPase
VLVVLDASQPVTAEDNDLLQLARSRPTIVVGNKSDLAFSGQWSAVGDPLTSIKVSALTGDGISDLRAEISRHVGGETGTPGESGFLTNVRHQGLVKDSLAALEAATLAVRGKVPHEMLLLDLYNALRPLDAITGATTTDDILNLIFSRFCIGK